MLAAVTVIAVAASYVGWQSDTGEPSSRTRGRAAAANRQEVDRIMGALQAEVRTAPSASAFTELGQLYLQRARDDGDLASYGEAETAATRALELAPSDLAARILRASVLYAMHDFAGALALAQEIVDEDPSQTAALAVSGDARLELGDDEGAALAYGELAQAHPDAAAVDVRLARLAYMKGRNDEAVRLATRAVANARGAALGGTSLAFYQIFAGHLLVDTGKYERAAEAFSAALEEAPGWPPALVGLAEARISQGRRTQAIGLLEQAAGAQPQPDVLAALGDLYRLEGRDEEAAARYADAERIYTAPGMSQKVYTRQVANYYADHDVRLDDALRISAADLETRKDAFGYDTYAWALFKIGRTVEARAASEAALATGIADPHLLFRAGMIASAAGDTERAKDLLTRALAISPQFDPVQARTARDTLAAARRR